MLRTVELPGGIGLGSVCPHCSKVYAHYDIEKDEALEAPDTCKRCGSPMDMKEEVAFGNKRAIAEQQNWPHRRAVEAEAVPV